jgi:hypothetical protein
VSLFEGLSAVANVSHFSATYTSGSDMAAAQAAVASADLVIVTVGGILGHEGLDRVNITLPQPQPALVEAMIVSCAAKKIPLILVLVNGEPVAVDAYAARVGTMVEAMEGGQSAGTALSDVLFGVVSPSGMLPFTMYPADFVNQVPMSDMSMRPSATSPGHTYRFYTGAPTFAFGHSISYATWGLSWGKSMPAATQTEAALRAVPARQDWLRRRLGPAAHAGSRREGVCRQRSERQRHIRHGPDQRHVRLLRLRQGGRGLDQGGEFVPAVGDRWRRRQNRELLRHGPLMHVPVK